MDSAGSVRHGPSPSTSSLSTPSLSTPSLSNTLASSTDLSPSASPKVLINDVHDSVRREPF